MRVNVVVARVAVGLQERKGIRIVSALDQCQDHGQDHDHDQCQDHGQDQDQDQCQDQDRDHGHDQDQDRDHDQDHGQDQDRDHDRDQDRNQDQDHNRDQDQLSRSVSPVHQEKDQALGLLVIMSLSLLFLTKDKIYDLYDHPSINM